MRIFKVQNGVKNTLGITKTELKELDKITTNNRSNFINIKERALNSFNLAKRRAKDAFPKSIRNDSEINALIFKCYVKAQKKNILTKSFGENSKGTFQVDHIIPLHGENVCGLHVPWNLHVTNSTINQSKGILIVDEYNDKDIVSQKRIQAERLEISNNKKQKMKEEKRLRRRLKKMKRNRNEIDSYKQFLYKVGDV